MRIVLQYTDHSFDRIKTRPTALQNFAARPERVFESSAIFLLFSRRYFASLDGAGATMDHELDFLPGRCGWDFLPMRDRSTKSERKTMDCQRSQLHHSKGQGDCF